MRETFQIVFIDLHIHPFDMLVKCSTDDRDNLTYQYSLKANICGYNIVQGKDNLHISGVLNNTAG